MVSSGKTKILIDCGVSGKTITDCLNGAGISPDEISAVLITHEHSDHIKGVGIFSRKYNIPIYARRPTWEAMMPALGKIDESNIHIIQSEFDMGDIRISPFDIPHDAASPVGYVFESGCDRAALATDMGEISDTVFNAIKGCRCVFLESNYDNNMLDMGKYPYELKRRIRSSMGHLCNDDAARFAVELAKSGTREIILGHLSCENNYPALAYHTVKNELTDAGVRVNDDVLLSVAQRNEAGLYYRT